MTQAIAAQVFVVILLALAVGCLCTGSPFTALFAFIVAACIAPAAEDEAEAEGYVLEKIEDDEE